MGIQPLRLGISGSAVALIACSAWFVATDQPSKVRQRATDAQAESLAVTRAAANGVSVEEMKRRAYAGCNFAVDPTGHPGEFFQRDLNVQDAYTSRASCITSYIYGDGLMYESMPDLFKEWAIAILKVLAIAIAAGVAVGVFFIASTAAAKWWWQWLRERG
jgi:hypothetical protein